MNFSIQKKQKPQSSLFPESILPWILNILYFTLTYLHCIKHFLTSYVSKNLVDDNSTNDFKEKGYLKPNPLLLDPHKDQHWWLKT